MSFRIDLILLLFGNTGQCEGCPHCPEQADGSQNIYLMQVEDVMKTLKEVPVGETVTVAKLVGEGAVKRRIMDMGVTKGVSVFVRKVAPLGDPVEVTVRGYELTLRNGEAEHIVVE